MTCTWHGRLQWSKVQAISWSMSGVAVIAWQTMRSVLVMGLSVLYPPSLWLGNPQTYAKVCVCGCDVSNYVVCMCNVSMFIKLIWYSIKKCLSFLSWSLYLYTVWYHLIYIYIFVQSLIHCILKKNFLKFYPWLIVI